MKRFDGISSALETPSYIAFDSEWTKNFRIKNGNRPFCFSAVAFPATAALDEEIPISVYYAYVDSQEEEAELVSDADRLLQKILAAGEHILVGHQLSSDLAALMNVSASRSLPGLSTARTAWRDRRTLFSGSRVVDTRYDLDTLLTIKSRRLVDVCEELNLGVVQPELRNTSMTALQRKFLESGDESIRERLQVMNIRHSLSCAVLALIGDLENRPEQPLNLNRVLHRRLRDQFEYVASPDFIALI